MDDDSSFDFQPGVSVAELGEQVVREGTQESGDSPVVPAASGASVSVTRTPPPPGGWSFDDNHTDCRCDDTVEMGLMVFCDTCGRWSHGRCFGIFEQRFIPPGSYTCHYCDPVAPRFGDLVFVKIPSFPPWPARVASLSEASTTVLNTPHGDTDVLVRFFGGRADFGWVDPSSSNWIGSFHAESSAPLRAKKSPATLAKAINYAKAWKAADLVELTLGLEASLTKGLGAAIDVAATSESKKRGRSSKAVQAQTSPKSTGDDETDDESLGQTLDSLRAKIKSQNRLIASLRAELAKVKGERRATPSGKRKRSTGGTDGTGKRSLNPYQQFCKEQQPIVRNESPHLSSAEVMKVIAGRWRARIGVDLPSPAAAPAAPTAPSTASTAPPPPPPSSSASSAPSTDPPPKVVRISVVGNEVVDAPADPAPAPASSGPVKFAIIGNELVPV
uniref:PWWP domain-containing protein n=1 Tax=Sexangularia sp. CB-2014 TaxID=1486929 RepID=A0A7S1V4E8_9EUKA